MAKKQTVSNRINLPIYLHKKVKIEAIKRGIGLHELMVKLIAKGLDKK